ncbi:energy transducer TonB [Yunchengibacter salinarum]|uniref:energy transducer TonB n=1 Tax=Yunchengibacter salinarum TaxID=3133399 RepID=UPI0035B5A0E1
MTFALFFLMQALVAYKDEVVLDEEASVRFLDVVEDIDEQPPKRKERQIEKPPEVETPPPEMETPQVEMDGPSSMTAGIGRAQVDSDFSSSGLDLGQSQDGDYLPLVRVQPQYPRRARERGIEGYTIVELTVAKDGTVPEDSIRIVEADPKGYFERASRRAAAKFKYKPKVVNGQPQEVTGVQYRFTFQLADGGRR